MANLLNLHKLFDNHNGYLGQLKVDDLDRRELGRVRETARKAIKEALQNWGRFVTKSELLEGTAQNSENFKFARPKFRIQGSFAYHTANDCQRPPYQQIDQDDGLFLPISFIASNLNSRPNITAKGYFKLVEAALKPVCDREGWTLNPPPIKGSCVRIGINERLHLDIPLFAVSDETFQNLRESVIKAVMTGDSFRADEGSTREDDELPEAIYKALQDNEIVLAHRKEGWVPSDPRKLEIWFEAAIDTYGEVVRRLSRAFKGWRDAHWPECDLSSICIMAAVVKAISIHYPLDDNRDDLSLLTVGREMVDIFSSPIENPALPGDSESTLCRGWKPEFRNEVRRTLAASCSNLEKALSDTMHKGLAIDAARRAFGERVPADETLISYVGVASSVRQVAPVQQPKPMVPRTTSG